MTAVTHRKSVGNCFYWRSVGIKLCFIIVNIYIFWHETKCKTHTFKQYKSYHQISIILSNCLLKKTFNERIAWLIKQVFSTIKSFGNLIFHSFTTGSGSSSTYDLDTNLKPTRISYWSRFMTIKEFDVIKSAWKNW